MKPHPRIRKKIKWGGAVVTVALLVVWVGSAFSFAYWTDGAGNSIGVSLGAVWWDRWDPAVPMPRAQRPGWRHGVPQAPMVWRFEKKVTGPLTHGVVPLWLILVLVAGISGAAWWPDVRVRRRSRAGCCISCGYDRTGLEHDAVCPECGTLSKS